MYREVGSNPVDSEALALAEITRRVARTQRAVMLVSMILGAGGAVVGVRAVLSAQFAMAGRASVHLTSLLGCCAPVVLAFFIGRVVADTIVQERLSGWITEAAEHHGVPPGPIREMAGSLWR